MRRPSFMYLAMALLGLGLVGWVVYGTLGLVSARLDDKAPEFTLSDLSGNQVSLSDFRGRPVLVNMWATWCPSCKAELPELAKFHAQNGDRVAVLAINVQEDPDTVSSYLNAQGLSLPVLLDRDGTVGNLYRVDSVPTAIFIDKEGFIRGVKVGQMTAEEMLARMTPLF